MVASQQTTTTSLQQRQGTRQKQGNNELISFFIFCTLVLSWLLYLNLFGEEETQGNLTILSSLQTTDDDGTTNAN